LIYRIVKTKSQRDKMKRKLRNLTAMGFILASTFQIHAQGYIVPNGVTYVGYSDIFSGYLMNVIQNPTNSDYTGFALSPVGKTPPTSLYTNTFSFSIYVDEGVRVFLVSANDPISLQPILSLSYTELLYPNSYVFADGVQFYVGLYTGYNPWDSHGNYTGIYTNPLFGWAELLNNNGVIQLLDSGLEIEGGGIYAGTQNIIPTPEPSELALGALGALLLGYRRWRNSSR